MSIKEEVFRLVEELPESDLLTVKRMLRGLRLPQETEPPRPLLTPEERRAKARAGLGAFADVPGSVDDFLARKHAEKRREDERDQRRQAGLA